MILYTKCKTRIQLNDNTILYLRTHPGIIKILPEVLSKIFLKSNILEYKKEIDLKKNIGFTSLKKVEQISINEKTWFARRNNRNNFSRVFFSSNPIVTSIVSVILRKDENSKWSLISSWYGNMAPKEPWDLSLVKGSEEFVESIRFWCNHALLYDKRVMGNPEKKSWNDLLDILNINSD